MHELKIPPQVVERVVQRAGRAHPFDVITPAKTAFAVVDMQNHFVKQGFPGEVPLARAIVPAINRLAAALRELGGRGEDAQIVKTRFSAFIQGSSDLEAWLRGRGIDTLLIGGTATHVCCESTARDAMMLNFKVVMVADVLATYDDATHNASLSAFYSNFGDVQTVDETIASMRRGLAQAAA